MNRALTASAATGSLSALVWQVVHEFFQQPVTCPVPEVLPSLVLEAPAAFTFNSLKELSIDLPSLALGILLGLSIGPLLDFCFFAEAELEKFCSCKAVATLEAT